MRAKVLQMRAVNIAAGSFRYKVETVEPDVSFEIGSIADEDGTCRMCQIDLPNPGPHGGLCRALLAPEHVDALIEALNAWKALA